MTRIVRFIQYQRRAAGRENLSLGFSTSSDTNRTAQPKKMDRVLKFQIYEVNGLYYLCSENKELICAFVFCICKNKFSHDTAQKYQQFYQI